MADESIGQLLELLRDTRRPTFELVLETIADALETVGHVDPVLDGPDAWSWIDRSMEELGMPKYFVLTQSLMEGVEGYPLLTIRQGYGLRLDTWITMSSLIVGPDRDGIMRSISMLIAHHMGAVAGIKYGTSASASAHGNPAAALHAAQTLMEMIPPEFTQSDEDVLLGGIPAADTRDLN